MSHNPKCMQKFILNRQSCTSPYKLLTSVANDAFLATFCRWFWMVFTFWNSGKPKTSKSRGGRLKHALDVTKPQSREKVGLNNLKDVRRCPDTGLEVPKHQTVWFKQAWEGQTLEQVGSKTREGRLKQASPKHVPKLTFSVAKNAKKVSLNKPDCLRQPISKSQVLQEPLFV